MKIAMLMDKNTRAQVLDQETIRRFATHGELAWNETEQNETENAKRIIRGADVAVTSWGSPPMTKELLDEAPGLKLVLHAAGSVKPIVTEEMYRRGIRIISSAYVLSSGVSETALGLTIASCKNFFSLNQEIRQGGWSHTDITDLYGITVGIVGFGIAGSHFAELLANFSVKVISYDLYVPAPRMEALGVEKVQFEELLRRSDVVSLHAPSIDETYHMINSKTLQKMKDGAILINTARGSLVDQEALIHALESGKLKAACLDVTDPEPPAPDSRLRTLPNCILTPHLAGQAGNGLRKIGLHCCLELERFLAGKPLLYGVTEEMLARMA